MSKTSHLGTKPKAGRAPVSRNDAIVRQGRFQLERRSRGARGSSVTSADAQAQLAHASRVAALGEISASIVHEVNQPLTAIAANAAAGLRWLTRPQPEIREAISNMQKIVRDVKRASAVIQRARNSTPHMSKLDINSVVNEVVTLIEEEACSQHVSLRVDCGSGLAPVHGDAIQLQQVITNLVVNGIEAMASINDRLRELLIRTRRYDSHTVFVAVRDLGVGPDTEDLDQLFRPFYTTKSNGMGMGLAISRSIIEAHHGRIWAVRNRASGMTFQFTLPIHQPA